MNNRHERRRSLKFMEIKTFTGEEIAKMTGRHCCFDGCRNHYDSKDGMPKGWQAIIMFGDPTPVLHLGEIKDWKRDGVLCPEHAEAVQDLLFPLDGLEVATMPSEGMA
jgi:hypothetical protein